MVVEFDKERQTPVPAEASATSPAHRSEGGTSSPNGSDASFDLPPDDQTPGQAGGGGWAQDLVNKLVANVSVTIKNLIVRYVEGKIVSSLRIKEFQLYTCDGSWKRQFAELQGPWKLVHRVVALNGLSVRLGVLNNASSSSGVDSDVILKNVSVLLRAQIHSVDNPSVWDLQDFLWSPEGKRPNLPP